MGPIRERCGCYLDQESKLRLNVQTQFWLVIVTHKSAKVQTDSVLY